MKNNANLPKTPVKNEAKTINKEKTVELDPFSS